MAANPGPVSHGPKIGAAGSERTISGTRDRSMKSAAGNEEECWWAEGAAASTANGRAGPLNRPIHRRAPGERGGERSGDAGRRQQ